MKENEQNDVYCNCMRTRNCSELAYGEERSVNVIGLSFLFAEVVELEGTTDLKSVGEIHEGSNPFFGTTNYIFLANVSEVSIFVKN